jgi:hypothetical protein
MDTSRALAAHLVNDILRRLIPCWFYMSWGRDVFGDNANTAQLAVISDIIDLYTLRSPKNETTPIL